MKLKALIIVLLLISCKEQNPSEINLGSFELSEKSKNIFPYQNNEKQLIFKDYFGNKIVYEVTKFRNYHDTGTAYSSALFSTENTTKIKLTKEIQEIFLETNSDLLQNFMIELSTYYSSIEPEKLTEYDCMDFFRGGGSTSGIITDIKNAPTTYINNQPQNKEIIIINGVEYKNVFEIKNGDINDIYYDLKKGIIAINEYRDNRKPKYWVLDSIIYKN